MEDEQSSWFFFYKKILGLLALVWVKTHFPLESPFIDLIYKSLFDSFAEA